MSRHQPTAIRWREGLTEEWHYAIRIGDLWTHEDSWCDDTQLTLKIREARDVEVLDR